MKQLILKLVFSLFLGNVLLSSCSRKEETGNPPHHPPPMLTNTFQVTIDSIPGLPLAPVSNLFALVTVLNAQNQPILDNRKLPLGFDGKFKTQELELPAGNYRVTRLLLADATNQVRFAAPITNSARAAGVNRPLPANFILPQPAVMQVPAEVLPVQAGDSPESFGYPAGTFNNTGQNPPGNTDNFIKINLRAAITIGELRYDSIPATVLYTFWDENQQPTARNIILAAGSNEISLPRNASRHHFRMNKWGADYELALQKAEIREGNAYTLGGMKQAKKLKSLLVYKLVEGNYKPDTKTVFNYQPNGSLSEIQYFSRKADNTPYMSRRDLFRYNNNQLQKIDWYDEFNSFTGGTSFTYNAAGKVSGIEEEALNGIRTTASVGYHYSSATRLTEVIFSYSYSHHPNNMMYYQRYFEGNRVSDNSNSTNQSTETGQYGYDNQVNPFAHMGWLNLFLSNSSKNNMISQQKTYYGNYPVAVPYSFAYTYDAEGYPVELVQQFKSYLTNQHLFTTKTVFNY